MQNTSKTRARVTQITPEEAARLRAEGARRVVDASGDWADGGDSHRTAAPTGGGIVARAARAVVGGCRAVVGAATGAVDALSRNREQVILVSKAGAAMVAKWGYDAAVEAIRAEIRRKVTGAFASSRPKADG